jgi:hypothetical protein
VQQSCAGTAAAVIKAAHSPAPRHQSRPVVACREKVSQANDMAGKNETALTKATHSGLEAYTEVLYTYLAALLCPAPPSWPPMPPAPPAPAATLLFSLFR